MIELKNFAEELKKRYKNIVFDVNYEETAVELTAELIVKEYFNDIFLKIKLYEKGFFAITFIFDQIKIDEDVNKLINDFNQYTIFKGYTSEINDKLFFVVQNEIPIVDNLERALFYVDIYLDELLEDECLELLLPITNLTFGE